MKPCVPLQSTVSFCPWWIKRKAGPPYHENLQKAVQSDLGLSVELQRLRAVAEQPLAAQSVLLEPNCWAALRCWWPAQKPGRWAWSVQLVPEEPLKEGGAVCPQREAVAVAAAVAVGASAGNVAGERASQRT